MTDIFEDDLLDDILSKSAQESYDMTMNFIRENHIDPIGQETEQGSSLEEQLYDAISRVDTRQAKILLADGADANFIWRDGEPLLFHAIGTGDLDLVKALLAFGADLMAKDAWGGFSAIHAAVVSESMDMFRFVAESMIVLGRPKDDLFQESLFMAVCTHNHDFAEALLDVGVDPDKDEFGGNKFYVPLLQAARLYDKKMVKILLDHGATVAKDSYMVQRVLESE